MQIMQIDDLQVTALTYVSSIPFLQELYVPMSDYGQHAMKIGLKLN